MQEEHMLKAEIRTVDAERVERHIEEKLIGERIRRLRLRRSMGLVELGRRTGLSASFLSQLETARVVPTVRNLARIALVFGKDLSYFVRPESNKPFRLLARKDRISIVVRKHNNDSRFVSESMSSLIPDRQLVPCIAEFHPNGEECEFTPTVFVGTEFVYVIDGIVEITAGSQVHQLETADACWIDAGTVRKYRAIGMESAKAMIITQPKSGLRHERMLVSASQSSPRMKKSTMPTRIVESIDPPEIFIPVFATTQ